MSGLMATSLHGVYHQRVDGGTGSASEPQDARSFADMLLERIGRELSSGDGAERPLGGGMMQSTVDAFDARGLLGVGSPENAADSGGTLARSVSNGKPNMPAQGAPAVGSISPDGRTAHLSKTTSGPGGLGGVSQDASTNEPMSADPSRPEQFLPTAMSALSDGAEPAVILSPPTGQPFRAADPASEGAASLRSSPPRTPANEAASTLKVALDMRETEVAVSVVGDPLDACQETMLHHAVAQLLVRHGLVLSELRVTRRPSSDGRKQGER